jgi:hypothetical protein
MAAAAEQPRFRTRERCDRRPLQEAAILADKSPDELATYILKWDGHLDKWFGPRMQVAGKRVLVIGSQYGTEVVWALRRGAAEVIGLDPDGCSSAALEIALDRTGHENRKGDLRLIPATTHDAGDIGTFDYVMSNNVFEHIDDLSHTLRSVARFMPAPDARLIIFADPLFYSSQGHHLRAGSWQHLTMGQDALRAQTPPQQWNAYRRMLNGMTITSFLGAVREAGLILLDLGVVPDRAIAEFPAIQDQLPPGLKPMDLCLEGLVCTLAFPHNIAA